MSDLQVSLLIIGAVVVGGVTAFNWFQQWRLRRRLEQAFGDKHEDVLLRERPARGPADKLEPQIASASRAQQQIEEPPARVSAQAPVSRAPSAEGLPSVPGFEP